jgi:hypothetical protein
MEFLIAMLFGAFVNSSVIATNSLEDCKKLEFKPQACKVAKTYHDLGK